MVELVKNRARVGGKEGGGRWVRDCTYMIGSKYRKQAGPPFHPILPVLKQNELVTSTRKTHPHGTYERGLSVEKFAATETAILSLSGSASSVQYKG